MKHCAAWQTTNPESSGAYLQGTGRKDDCRNHERRGGTERSAANRVTGTAWQLATALAPTIAGTVLGVAALTGVPFFAAGGLKIVYDFNLWRMFRTVKPPEERTAA